MIEIQEKLKSLFSGSNILLPIDLIKIASKSRIKRLKKGELFVQGGELNYQCCTVLKGLLRHYIMLENGDEKNIRFVAEKGHSGSPDTLIHHEVSGEFIEALEDTTLLVIDYRHIEEMGRKNDRIMRQLNQVYREIISENVKYIKFLNCYSPEKRYRMFLKEHPNLERRIKQKHLASYLGITPTSLSRLKARIDFGKSQ